jgi:hypothetical protein
LVLSPRSVDDPERRDHGSLQPVVFLLSSRTCLRFILQIGPTEELNSGGANTTVEARMSRHSFKVGQLVTYSNRESASGLYEVTQLLPPEGDVFQYRN